MERIQKKNHCPIKSTQVALTPKRPVTVYVMTCEGKKIPDLDKWMKASGMEPVEVETKTPNCNPHPQVFKTVKRKTLLTGDQIVIRSEFLGSHALFFMKPDYNARSFLQAEIENRAEEDAEYHSFCHAICLSLRKQKYIYLPHNSLSIYHTLTTTN